VRSTLQASIPDYSKFIGIPYEEKNCWDLAVAFYSDILDIPLDWIYSGKVPPRSDSEKLISSSKGDFDAVNPPEFGDLITIKIFGFESHIGVYLGDGKFLHTTIGTGSCIERVDKWKYRITGYYRIKK
jgi:cell wall-associated NlpC family hydrolase